MSRLHQVHEVGERERARTCKVTITVQASLPPERSSCSPIQGSSATVESEAQACS